MNIKENVEKCLENIRPALEMHKGNVELIDVVDGVVRVKLQGACKGCPMSQITLKMGIEAEIMANVAGITGVEGVDDEACCDDVHKEDGCCTSNKTEDDWFNELVGDDTNV